MAYPKEIYERADELLAARRKQAEDTAEERRRRFALEEPLYPAQNQEMVRSVMEVMKVIGMGEQTKEFVDGLKKRNLAAQQRVRELLSAHHYPEDYLETHYTCPLCEDTGYAGQHFCECRRTLVKKLAFEEAGRQSPLSFSRFEDFDLSFYPTEHIPGDTEACRTVMARNLDFCRAYAEDFDMDSQSLLLYGETGLGKTHLSLAIAGSVIDKGFFVLYNSTQNIMNALERERFSRSGNDGEFEKMLLESDLLIMDDLGTEFSTQFTLSAVYNIINTRLLANRPTIISTNLLLGGIEEKYTRRVASRIVGEYALLRFFGKDVRQIKKDRE